jgi:uncharacterized protein
MTLSSLRALNRKALTTLAKKHQVAGWHEMTKDELVAALAVRLRRRVRAGRAAIRGRQASTPVEADRLRESSRPDADARTKVARRVLGGGHLNGRRLLKPSVVATAPSDVRDLLTAEGRDPCWIHVRWTLSRDTLARAEAALGMQWHRALPILRVFDVTADDATISSQVRVRDVEIHGDVDHWYLPVEHAPRTYQVQIGYRAPSGLFFVMAQSNRVQTPRPESYSLRSREAGMQRPMAGVSGSAFDLEKMPSYDLRALPTAKLGNGHATGAAAAGEEGETVSPPPVELRLHAELIVHGSTDPQAELKLLGDRVPISRDGTFSHRFSLLEGRQVIDAVVTTRNGCHQRTIVLGIERNTKELEPQWFDEINA